MVLSLELKAQRRITAAFIQVNPTQITLSAYRRVNSGTGAKYLKEKDRKQQTFRIIDQSSISGPQPGTVLASDGKQRKIECQLLGEHDVEIGLYDRWTDERGVIWEVADLFMDNGYERRAQVVRYGEA